MTVTNGSSKYIRANRALPAIFAVSSSLAVIPASALELGDVTVHSRLGQPLRASIAYALAPTEQIVDYCVKMRPGASVSGLPGFGEATISVANGVIMLTGKTPVREPMVSAHVVINCPYSANLSREYLLFIDPLSSPYEQTTVTQPVVTEATAASTVPVAVSRPVTRTVVKPILKDIGRSTSYQVQAGESLSEIAQRIENRPIGLWPAVNAIFEANPEAFINNDPNQLKAGSWLAIPDFSASAVEVATVDAVEPAGDPAVDSMAIAIDAAYPGAETYEPETAGDAAPLEVILDDLVNPGVSSSELQPGDIILDTRIEAPATASTSPNVPTAIISPANTATDGGASATWLTWLAGSGIALLFGLMMFGRRLRKKPVVAPEATEQPNRRRSSDTESSDTENLAAIGVDHDISDDSPTHENLVLDADLIIGTGLTSGSDADISQDFGFAASTDLDVELPFEPVASDSEKTDMLPPLRTDEHSILDSEILPDDDDYDMSVIVDATKIPRTEEITKRDLKAVEVDLGDESMIAPSYTINKQVDYQVLEQDYEDEMTATQALNEEISRVAAELAMRLDEESDKSDTTALPLATVTELDITAQMRAQNDEISDLDDTGINAAITVNIASDEETVEMPLETKKAR